LKRIFVTALILLSIPCWAAPNRTEYPITVHVSASRLGYIINSSGSPSLGPQQLTATIEGRHYELAAGDFRALGRRQGLVAIGDYKARIVKQEGKANYEIIRVYEFLFPDNTTERFAVVGMSE